MLAIALAVRLAELDTVMMLADGSGPWLTALALPLHLRAHAPPYGWALSLPYALALALAGDLRQAVGVELLFHALVAPLAFLTVLRLRAAAWLPAASAGLLVALDGGLMDTVRSGAEGYLVASWVGVLALGVAARHRSWGPPLALLAWAMAVMNHPLAICTLPLLVMLPWRHRRTWGTALLAGALLIPQGLGLLDALPGSGAGGLSPGVAVDAQGDLRGKGPREPFRRVRVQGLEPQPLS